MRSRRLPLNALSVLAMLVATVFGVLLLASKVSAQEIPSGSSTAATTTSVPVRPVPTASASGSTSIASNGGSRGTLLIGSVQTTSSATPPIDYAVVQTPEDLPADLSDEERSSLGTGKVPIHKEGA